jgi:hypothetical protein
MTRQPASTMRSRDMLSQYQYQYPQQTSVSSPMFLNLTSLLTATRLFSTSAVLQSYKLKSHSGAKKRWRSLASGTFKRVGSYSRVTDAAHLLLNSCYSSLATGESWSFTSKCHKEARQTEPIIWNCIFARRTDAKVKEVAAVWIRSHKVSLGQVHLVCRFVH